MKVAIIYNRLYDFDKEHLSIGGIQTYLLRLAELIKEMGWGVAIFQLSKNSFAREYNGATIIGVSGIPLESKPKDIGEFLIKHAEVWISQEPGIVIFGSDSYCVNTAFRSIAIQHGVSWDLPTRENFEYSPRDQQTTTYYNQPLLQSFFNRLRRSRLNYFRRMWLRQTTIYDRQQMSVKNMVCVDYNFVNASKADGASINARMWVIPNFAELASEPKIADQNRESATVRILFARRFIWYRGTRLITPVFKRILASFPNVFITFAGEGPDENWLQSQFRDYDRVKFIKYTHDQSAQILQTHDISVVPSLGSEGTSLSAIEAMANGCCVVATGVGGLTNVLIDGFNGKLVSPDEEEIYSALRDTITNVNLRTRLVATAYATVQASLTLDIWKEKWRRVLMLISAQ
ncbi:glycosyltransferase family 4 protein [Noviherbaspirillum malthae]|uniref:glycosyltransferase family 4 protein n=1 Tax=Noviherbaspirillum malthae TaxID=1260987 RepID=UPI00188FC5BA|nr:glycosyltransferase family 4 protein [Noviherbaspirillum malthae]